MAPTGDKRRVKMIGSSRGQEIERGGVVINRCSGGGSVVLARRAFEVAASFGSCWVRASVEHHLRGESL